MSAQFDLLVEDELAPWLKTRGFRKKGLIFARRNDAGWSVIQLQKVRELTRASTTFAVNVSTFSDRIATTLAPLRRVPPVTTTPSEAACHLRRRLQELLPAGAMRDEHVVDENTDLEQLGATLRAALETYALPFLDALVTDRGLHAYWSMHAPRPGEELEHVVLVRAFDTPDALERLATHLRQITNPVPTKFLEILDQLAGPHARPRVKLDPITRQMIRSMKEGLAVERSDPVAFERSLRRCIELDDGAATDLRGDAHLPPFRLRTYLIYARFLVDRGSPERALAIAQPLLGRWPAEPHLHMLLGNAFDELEDWAAAEAAFRSANDLDPKPFLCSRIANMIDKQGGRAEEAIEWLHRTLDLDPDYEEAHYNLGYIDERDGDFESAIERYRHALELDPNYAEPRARLGPLLNRRRR